MSPAGTRKTTGTTQASNRAPRSGSRSTTSRSKSPRSTPRSSAGGRSAKPRRRTAGRDRFEARRRAVERGRGRRRLRIVLGLTVVTSLSVGVIAFINSSWFDVDAVSVVGADRADPELVIEASGIELGQGLLEIDLDRAARAVELVPWVGTAPGDRNWAGAVEIAITERGPAVAISAGPRFSLVDDHGRQLEIVDQRPEGFPSIEGIEGSGVPGEAAPDEVLPVIAVLEALPAESEEPISAVVVVDGDINLILAGGGRANLGDGSELGAKLQAFETVMARVDLSCLDTIDVRVPSAPVVTRTADLPPPAGGTGVENDPGGNPDTPPVDC